jgi:hypothetical protein
MKKILKIASIVILVLIAIIIITPFLFKKQIETGVQKAINQNLNAFVKFDDFSLSLIKGFPNFYVSLENLTLVGKDTFAKDTLVAFKSLSAKVDFMSVIRMKDINIKAIILDHPTIYAHVLRDGRANWNIMKDTTTAPKDTTVKGKPMQFKASLKKFAIIQANIKYDDDTMKMHASIKNLDFLLKGDMTQDFTSLDIKSTIEALDVKYQGIKYVTKTALRFDAILDADLKNSKYELKENEIALNDLVMSLTGNIIMPGDDIAMNLKFLTQQSDFKSVLSLVPAVYLSDFKNVQTNGKFKLNAWVKGVYGKKSMPSAGITLIVDNARFKYPSLPKSAEKINIDFTALYNGNHQDSTKVDLNKFHIEMAGNPLDAELHVRTPMSDPQLKGLISGKFDLVSIKDVIPLEDMTLKGLVTADVKMSGRMSSITKQKYDEFQALGKIALSNFEFKTKDFPQTVYISNLILWFSPAFVELTAFDSKIGKSDFHLKGKIENFIQYALKNETIKGKFDFTSNLIDVNEFMTGGEKKTTATTKDTTPLSVIPIPGNIDFSLTSSLSQVNYDKLIIKNINGFIIVKDRKATMQQLKMELLQGKMIVNGEYNTQDVKKPLTNFDLAIDNFDIPSTFNSFSMVQKLAPVAKNAKGKVSIGLKISTALDEHMSPVYPTLQGKGILKSNNVEISNSGTFNKIADLLKNEKLRKLSLNDLNISFEIKNGRIYIQPFESKFGPNAMVMGGDQGIDQTMNYLITFTMPRSEFGSAANSMLNNLTSQAAAKGIPIKPGDKLNINAIVKGIVSKPEVKLSLINSSKNLKEQMKDQVKGVIDQKKQEIKEQVNKQADKLIKNAETEAGKIRDAAKVTAGQVRKEANDKAAAIEQQAKGRPKILQDVAKKSADKVRQEGEKKAQGIEKEADSKSNAVIQKAKDEADKIK